MDNAVQLHQSGMPPTQGGQWVSDASFDEIRSLVGESFAGNEQILGDPFTEWGTAHMDKSWYTTEMHQETMKFGIGFTIYNILQDERRKLILAKRDDSGKLVSVALVVARDEQQHPRRRAGRSIGQKVVDSWRMAKAYMKMKKSDEGIPELFSNKQHKADADRFVKTMDSFAVDCERFHTQYGPEARHWYVALVAVHPDFQGQGLGRELMERIAGLADAEGVSCFLECGERNVRLYQKMGYKVLSKVLFRDPVDANRQPFEGFLMLREPAMSGKMQKL
eukprot:CAMPEP_0198114722 /NCGR_PEP_ID=MMETSP1442-20131203/6019_1 /TAXON_ID= /ORGANISM="Craspedostauros australis, Strain CCMP3328" /LENGTH=277 /DNA_ID=CAMNT_0043772101 /DNA_START=215 /DNA_END=1048 /DNA_ORIENTATION=-